MAGFFKGQVKSSLSKPSKGKIENLHSGHRERLREQFEKHGLDSFADHQAIELLLTYAIPRGDVNPTAHKLMRHFHSLSTVLEASVEDLMEVEGMGPKSALFIRFMAEFFRRYDCDRNQTSEPLETVEDIFKYVRPLFLGVKNEVVYLLCLNSLGSVTHCEKISEGSINSTLFSVRRTIEIALNRKASGIIIAHNHPQGLAQPSGADLYTTKRLILGLGPVGIPLIDHIIVADDASCSLRSHGHLQDCEKKAEDLFIQENLL